MLVDMRLGDDIKIFTVEFGIISSDVQLQYFKVSIQSFNKTLRKLFECSCCLKPKSLNKILPHLPNPL